MDRHGRGRASAPARLGMRAQLSRPCEDPGSSGAGPAKHARRSASTALDRPDQCDRTLPCRIPQRAREAPVDDRQAQPAPAREKRFHACGEPRRILRNVGEPTASMSGWVSDSANQSWSRRPESPSPSSACPRRTPASGTPSDPWAWARSRRSRLLASGVCPRTDTGHTSREHESRLWVGNSAPGQGPRTSHPRTRARDIPYRAATATAAPAIAAPLPRFTARTARGEDSSRRARAAASV